jgi:hypothetical protein
MSKIFESPDGGATIYERESGEVYKTLVKENKTALEELYENRMWGEIRRMAKTNPAMKEYTDRCIELYHLLKKDNNG